MKQKFTNILCIVLLILQIGTLVNAEEERTVSGNDAAGMVSGGSVAGTVSGNDASGTTVSGNDASGTTVSGGDASGTVSGGDAVADESVTLFPEGDEGSKSVSANTVEPIDIDALEVVKLQVPRNMDFVMDPWQIGGRGSVWSQEYQFCNNGELPVRLTWDNIYCDVREGITCVGLEYDPESVENSSGKVVQLLLILDNGDTINVTEESSSYETLLEPGEALSVMVSGTISVPDAEEWESGDIMFSIVYSAAVCTD